MTTFINNVQLMPGLEFACKPDILREVFHIISLPQSGVELQRCQSAVPNGLFLAHVCWCRITVLQAPLKVKGGVPLFIGWPTWQIQWQLILDIFNSFWLLQSTDSLFLHSKLTLQLVILSAVVKLILAYSEDWLSFFFFFRKQLSKFLNLWVIILNMKNTI